MQPPDASKPADAGGVKVEAADALLRSIRRAEDRAGTFPANQSVKLIPTDWAQLCSDGRAAATALTAAQQTIERLTEARRAADYLIERLNASLSKKPVRDLDEAWIHYNSARAVLSGEETK